MALNRPTASELFAALREFLDRDVSPQVNDATRFHLRVAGNVLAMLEREMAQKPAADARELEALRALTGSDGTLGELNAALAERIRSGGFDEAMARRHLLAHLRATTDAKLAIDNPKYAQAP
jgi:hypothetical protein